MTYKVLVGSTFVNVSSDNKKIIAVAAELIKEKRHRLGIIILKEEYKRYCTSILSGICPRCTYAKLEKDYNYCPVCRLEIVHPEVEK